MAFLLILIQGLTQFWNIRVLIFQIDILFVIVEEIFCICVRLVDVTNAKPCIKDLCLDFLHLQRGTGEAVANGILTLLGRNGLDVSNIRGQSYDRASAMAGTHTNMVFLI